MSLARRLSSFYGVSFLVVGFYGPYFPIWLASQGYSVTLVGVLLSIPMFVRIVSLPLVTLVTDWLGRPRAVIFVLSTICLVCYAAPIPLPGWIGLALLTFASSVTFPAINPLVDSIAIVAGQKYGLDYGRIRVWGSVAFVIANLAGGMALARFGPGAVLDLIVGAMALVVVTTVLLPDEQHPGERSPVRLGDMGRLIADSRFALLLATVGAIQCSHGVLSGFASLSWQAHRISEDVVGFLWATGVVSEVLLMAFARRSLGQFGASGLLAIGAGASLVRWTAMGFDPPLALLFPLQALHGFTFGATHIGAMTLLGQIVPKRLAATAQGLYAAAISGVASGTTLLASGPLYAHLGVEAYWVMALFAAAGLALAIRLARNSAR